METFHKLFGSLLCFVYHCFDRIVVQGYLPLLTRPEHIVHFFRDVHRIAPITKEVLIQRTTEYKAWVEAFARDHGVPIAWPELGVKKEDHVRPYYERFARRRRVGVYFIFRSMEQGPKFHVLPPAHSTHRDHDGLDEVITMRGMRTEQRHAEHTGHTSHHVCPR